MKERQNTKHAVAGPGVNGLDHRFGVGRQVGVRQHDALGIACAAAGKDHRGQVVRPVTVQAKAARQDPGGQQHDRCDRAQAHPCRNLLADVFEVNQFHAGAGVQLHLRREQARGEDLTQAALANGRAHGVC